MKGIPILIVIAYVFVIAGMVGIFARMTINRAAASNENAYGLVNTCVLSVPATERTKANIENCYLRVEKKFDTNLERFYQEQ